MTTPSLAVISTVNAIEAELEPFLSYHLRSPDLVMIVFLDRSEHMEYACVAKYAGRVTFIPCSYEHWENELGRQPENMPEKQHTNIRAGARLAREMGLNWAISIDNDEFIYPLKGLRELIALHQEQGTEVLKLRPLEAVHDGTSAYSSPPFRTHYFRKRFGTDGDYYKAIRRTRGRLRMRLMQQHRLTRRGYWGHTQGKTIFHLNAPITDYKQHNQYSSERELREAVVPSHRILHFDAINYDHWHRKWLRRTLGETRATAVSGNRARLTSITRVALKLRWLGVDRLLFNWLYVFDPKELSELEEYGVIVTINHE